MVDLQALLSQLKSGQLPSSSQLDLMNEKRQFIPKGVGIPRFGYKFGKKSKILFRLGMAIPFNPQTGEVDENFNPNHKWRPPISVRSAAMLIKNFCNESSRAKEVFMNRAGISEWDTSTPEELNETDFKVLRTYRIPLVITTEAVTINDAGITGQDFGIPYSVSVKRDLDTGQMIGEIPQIAKIGSFMSAVTFKEVGELQEAIKLKDPSKYKNERPFINKSSIPAVDEQMQKEWVGKILGDAIISAVRPKNFLLAFEYDLSEGETMIDDEKKPLPAFMQLNSEDLKGHQVYFDYIKKYKEFIEKQLSSMATDHFWDFVEAHICDKASEEPKDKAAKAMASRSMSIAASSHSFYNVDSGKLRFDWVQPFLNAVSDFCDSDPEFEKKMLQFLAGRVRPIDDIIIGSVCDRIQEKIPLTYHYITDDILKTHKDALLMIYGEQYTTYLLEHNLIDDEVLPEAKEEKVPNSVNDIIEAAYEDSEVEHDVEDTSVNDSNTSVIDPGAGIKVAEVV